MDIRTYHQQLRTLAKAHYLPLARRIRFRPDPAQMIGENNDSEDDFQCPELVLQVLWNDQQFSGPLKTLAGDRLEIMSPGTWNVEPGPDFRGAQLCLNGRRVRGDVEIHHRAGDWYRHGHHQDRSYEHVVLHAVYETPKPGEAEGLPPCFVMSAALTGTLKPLVEEIAAQSYPYARRVAPGGCALRVALADSEQLQRWLRAAGLTRFWLKTRQMRQDIERRGAGQALYEHFFESLGYKANRTPFRRLAEAVSLADLHAFDGPAQRRATLFAEAGLLADPTMTALPETESAVLRQAWDDAWRGGRQALGLDWARTRTRPWNRPERRLYAGCLVLEKASYDLEAWLRQLARPAMPARQFVQNLEAGLRVSPDEGCLALAGMVPAGSAKTACLLGKSRIHDMLVNVFLPFLNATASQIGDEPLTRLAEEAYLLIPKLQNNRSLTEAAHRLFVPPSRLREVVRRACDQQGVLQIYQDFCLPLGNVCKNCPLASAAPVAHHLRRQ